MIPMEALELALNKEKEAVERYKKFEITYPVLRDMFIFLAEEERKHVKIIEDKIRELMK